MKSRVIRFARAIRYFAHHAITRMMVGTILFLTALYEIEEGLWIELQEDGIESHHGIAAFGVLTMVAAIPDLLEGLVAATEYVEGIDEVASKEGVGPDPNGTDVCSQQHGENDRLAGVIRTDGLKIR